LKINKSTKHLKGNVVMQEYTLDFGRFIYEDGIFESIINHDVEFDAPKVKEFFELIESIEPKPTLILVNRKNTYSLSFKANIMLATSQLVDYVAVLKYNRLPWPIKGVFFPKFYHLAFFDERNAAIEWLNSKKE
jgi:hypothetical protein